MNLDVRTITEDDLPNWVRARRTGYVLPPTPGRTELAFRRELMDLSRAQGAFDAGRCVATYRSFTQRISVPGGASVTANAVSNVSVSATHRRRGLLSRMIDRDLREAAERGDAAATLIAAEYPIYGRFGFGPATRVTEWEVDVARSGVDPRHAGPGDGGRVDYVDVSELRELGPALYERVRAVRHGLVDRTDVWWRRNTGALPMDDAPWTEPFAVVHRSAEGTVDGLLVFTADDRWEAKLPHQTATVLDLVAVSPAAERALWLFLLSVDWITSVRTGYRAPDDLLPDLLPDPRAARVVMDADLLWLRPLDVPALLRSRTYAVGGSLVLDVTDPAGPGPSSGSVGGGRSGSSGPAAGRFLLDAGPDGATCTRTTRPADLTLPAAVLGSLFLGGESAVRLAALGRVAEERPGAAGRADALLRTGRRPWCADIF
ncbi:GNAT family N-acetyltransferase [Streptosporangium nondiastaticum]|uniref:GNAT family N-acetyltransferase n=1 Tax=Streptosporangium nondiastaticum TaxID=35764 RepID=A0A9X7PJ50_9ACTN|nr:GNAT family N-acetyltransferase [Streptosporangium nondiastaticum]PSJ29889.1 GNAT family N-acetyltransferase [Streptosporangium nondiastaticum]